MRLRQQIVPGEANKFVSHFYGPHMVYLCKRRLSLLFKGANWLGANVFAE